MSEAAKINAAIAAAMGEIQPVAKDGTNAHQGYGFASIDAFMQLCRPILAKHGLHPNVDCVSSDIVSVGNKSWASNAYRITMRHSSGEATEPAGIHVYLPLTGAQTSGSAQSYAVKQYLRGLLLISTGDKDDADLAPAGPEDGYDATPAQQPRSLGDQWTAWADWAVAQIAACTTADQLDALDKQTDADSDRCAIEAPEEYERIKQASETKIKELQK